VNKECLVSETLPFENHLIFCESKKSEKSDYIMQKTRHRKEIREVYTHTHKSVVEHKDVKVLWNQGVHMDT
jgi:hypothetical protein